MGSLYLPLGPCLSKPISDGRGSRSKSEEEVGHCGSSNFCSIENWLIMVAVVEMYRWSWW